MTGDVKALSMPFEIRATRHESTDIPVAFESVVEPLMPDLLRYFARRVSPREDAADCLSETLLVLWRRRSRLPEATDERRAWAFGVARKVLANYQRSGVRRSIAYGFAVRAQLASPTTPTPSPAAESALVALEKLGETDRELIRLVVWDGFGVAEAGRVLGLRAGAARSRYSRARARLRELITDEVN